MLKIHTKKEEKILDIKSRHDICYANENNLILKHITYKRKFGYITRIYRKGKSMKRMLSALLVLTLLLSVINTSVLAMPAAPVYFQEECEETYTSTEEGYDEVNAPDEDENDEVYVPAVEDDYGAYDPVEEKSAGAPTAPEATYESIMPLSTVQVVDWAELLAAVDGVGPGDSVTIELMNNIPDAGHDAIVIVGGRNITLTSGAGGPFTLYQETTDQRHFVINQGTLTLQNVVLSGNRDNVAGNHGGIAFGVMNLVQRLYMEIGSVIENNRAGQGGGVFMAGSNAHFTVDGGIIRNNESTGAGGGVSITASSNFTMYSGDIEGNTATNQAGGIQVAASTFNMIDGNIYGNTANVGGGIFISNSAGTVNMQSGRIENNTAFNDGGGVSVTGSSTFTMTGGIIYDNNAIQGGGVHVLNPTSAAILSTFEMEGGRIENNFADTNGGGVMVWGGGVFTMTDGTIYDNDADNGGGVHIQGGGTLFTMSGGLIYENSSFGTGINNGGGGVNILSGTFTMENGTIRNNFAASNGGGVRRGPVADAFFNMTGGAISDNRTDGRGGGVFAQAETYEDPLQASAYPRITIGPDAIFSGNWAATGVFRPSSVDAVRNRIETASTTFFGHPINNFDINFMAGSPVTALTITYLTDARGTFNPPGDPEERTEIIDLDPDTIIFPISPLLVPELTPILGYIFTGWMLDGDPTETLLTEDDVREFIITDDTAFIAQFSPILFTVNFDLNGGVGNDTPLANVLWTQSNLLPAEPTRAGWTFTGWNVVVGGNMVGVTDAQTYATLALYNDSTESITLQAQWSQNETNGGESGNGGSGGGTGGGGPGIGGWVTVPSHHGTTTLRNGLPSDTTPTDTVRTHYLYVIGYPDGSFRPDAFITRAEVAAIALRISIEEFGNFKPGVTYSVDFQDIIGTEWFSTYIGFSQQNSLLRGYPSGNFEPQWNMTRAEFTAMMARFRGLVPYGVSTFPDASDHWATGYINILTVSVPGAIIGYEDGTFRPDAFITRAEAVKIVNYVLNRGVDAEGLGDVLYRGFPDISGHWAYFEIIEASNSHTFMPTPNGESWQSAWWDIWWRLPNSEL